MGNSAGTHGFSWIDENYLKRSFDDAVAAFQRGDFARARDLLMTVTRSRPDYQRLGMRADRILEEMERKPATPKFESDENQGGITVGAKIAVLAIVILLILMAIVAAIAANLANH